MIQVKSIRTIKLEQIKYRTRQNPGKKDIKVERKKNKLREQYWRKINSQKE